MSEPMLEIKQVSRRFGGVMALDDVSTSVAHGEVLGVVGANGAGKSTLFDVISGVTSPSGGDVVLDGRPITGRPQYEISRLGLARTFQRNLVFGDLTVEESIGLVVQRNEGGYWNLWRRARSLVPEREEVDRVLGISGLDPYRSRLASDLAHGLQRQLEVAMAVAARPKIMLLDEPTQGMSIAETIEMTEVLQSLRAQHQTLVIIEHDMSVVDSLVDRLVVLHLGQVIADGEPHVVRSSRVVQEAFLGLALDDA